MPSVNTLELRAMRKAAAAQAEQARRAEAAAHYGLRLARASKCRVYYCDACQSVFSEAEALGEGVGGWLRCPDCGWEVA